VKENALDTNGLCAQGLKIRYVVQLCIGHCRSLFDVERQDCNLRG